MKLEFSQLSSKNPHIY